MADAPEKTEPAPEEIPAPAGATKKGRPNSTFFGKDGQKKFRPGPKMRDAILEALGRKRAGYPPEYKVLGAKHSVNPGSLKKLVYDYEHGKLELGTTPDLVEKKKGELAVSNEKSFRFLTGYEELLLSAGEELLKKAKKELKDGNYLAFDQLGIPKIVAELKNARSLRNVVEKGNFDSLRELLELQARREAAGGGKVELTQNNTTVHVHAPSQDPAAAAKVVNGAASVAGGAAVRTNQQQLVAEVLRSVPGIRETHES